MNAAANFRALLALITCVGTLAAKPILPAVIRGNSTPAKESAATEIGAPIAEAEFDSVPAPLPPNLPSLGYHITGTSEFGQLVRLDGAAHFIESVTVTMSTWAIRSDFPNAATYGFTHPITLKIYDVDWRNGRPRPGRLVARQTSSFLIPWRPEPDPTAAPSPLRPWRGTDGSEYGGLAFNLTFDLSALRLALPDDVIIAIAFNTESHGEAPIGVDGPYNSLSVGLNAAPTAADPRRNAIFWETTETQFYNNTAGAPTSGLRADAGWDLGLAVRVNNSAFGTLAGIATRLADLALHDPGAAAAMGEAQKLLTAALDRNLWEDTRHVQTSWGPLVFDLLAEAANELSLVADRSDAAASTAARTLRSLLVVAHALADEAVAQAAATGGELHRLMRATGALERAATAEATRQTVAAVDGYGEAWREAKLSPP